MTAKEGKTYFEDRCAGFKIDCDKYIRLGAGNPKNETRFIFKSDHTQRKESQLFAIKYFEKENVYIAWNLKEKGGSCKDTFSLSKKKIAALKPKQVLAASKGIEYPSWDAENIFAFLPDAVDRFLKIYILPRTE